MAVLGWDIGGVNTKVVHVAGGSPVFVRSRPFELQRDPAGLTAVLRALAAEVFSDAQVTHAVTMTAELSQMFRTKREGVAFVLDAVEAAFPGSPTAVFAADGRFLSPADARQSPLAVAGANWAATARTVAGRHPDALLVDVGTTTTDVIPIAGGTVVATGFTDTARLMSGELVYTGVVRTPTEAISSYVPVGESLSGVSAEGFALAGDVHVWRGDLDPADYTCPTPDGRPVTRKFAGERLARVVCADREMLDEADVSRLAESLARAQARAVQSAIQRVSGRHPAIEMAVVTGLGTFLGRAAAAAAGLEVVPLAGELGEAAARCAPATSVALLFERQLSAVR